MTTADAIVLLAETLFFVLLAIVPTLLTVYMFQARQPMLGFPCGIFWAIFGAYCYILTTAAWLAAFYYIFWALFVASMLGMVIFTIYAAFAIRKKDLNPPDADKEKFIDEEKPADVRGDVEKDGNGTGDEEDVSPRQKAIRERASKRRSREPKPKMRSW